MDSAKSGSTGNTSMAEEKEQLGQQQEEEGGGEAEEESRRRNGMMKPWEQHSAVINIPRFDYNAPSSLLHRSHFGFLLTCPIKREKSATKEAISILQQFIGSFNSCSSECPKISDGDVDAKRRKICMGEIDHQECPSSTQGKSSAANIGKLLEDSCVEKAFAKWDSSTLSLVRLTRNGLLLLTFPSNDFPDVVDIVSKIMCSLESGSLVSPLWCHRIFPIQATCCLNEKDLRATVSKLVLQFVNDKQNKLARPVKFAVGYNRRGIEETEMKISKNTSKSHEDLALLDRNKCFSLVATAVNDVVTDSVVDLKSPELSVLVELLPISGLPKEALVVAVSVLPCNLVTTKPRLCIKALLSDTKAKNDGKKIDRGP
ncbi:hypothetical protein RHGRI_011850 [Rhododendron griersonianum]|uniref:THUMP domain-containing protein n=1 Tax=Rhododendron griersonianum TaxID=479676 RepID=A0AAV6KNB7_9ERIC|nr:hypothetical protein RHGRI_011850 [Rhododendron griersonianum]